MTIRASLLVVSMACLFPWQPLSAAEASKGDGATVQTPQPAPSAAEVAGAEAKMTAGYAAMQASNQDAKKSVEAALYFAEALPVFEAAGMHDQMREANANIFWCRKRMNHDDLERYVASKGSASSAAAATIELVVNRKIPVEDADKWLRDVDMYALENPDQPLKVAIRYFEVANRFVGTDASLKAQGKSLDYQAKAGVAATQAKRATLFNAPVQIVSGRQPVPDDREVRSAVTQLKRLYKDEYKDRSDSGKAELMNKFVEQAQRTKDDPVTRYALYVEALGFATDIKNVDQMLKVAEAQATAFNIDPTENKKAALGMLRLDLNAKAVLRLLDDPSDADANTQAGKYYAFDLRRWDAGFAMLSIGSDKTLAKLAEMEIAKPDGVQQELEIADSWYALGGSKNSETVACWDRAVRWYEKVLPRLEGVTKSKTESRMDEMFGVVFPSKVDWDNLTTAQWDKLKAPTVVVAANTPKTDTRVVLGAGQRARVVGHPTDTWTFTSYFSSGNQEVTFKGKRITSNIIMASGSDYGLPLGSMVMWKNDDMANRVVVEGNTIQGPCHIVLRSAQPEYASKGKIRAKIVILSD